MPRNRPQRPRQTLIQAPVGLTLRDVLERAERTSWREVKAWGSLHSNIKFLNERLGGHLIAAINAETLENFVARMYDQGYKPGTIKRKLATLSRALRLAYGWGLIGGVPPLPTVKVRNTKDRVLSVDEEGEVYRAIRMRHLREPWRRWDEFEDLVIVLLHTGARLGEVLGIRPEHIGGSGARHYVTFQRFETKNDKPRTVPLTEAAYCALKRSPIWHFNQTKAWFYWSLIRKDLAGLDDVTLHTLRHTSLTRLAQGGMDLMRLQKWAGHSDPRITTERYAHLQPSDLDGGVDILDRRNT